MFSSVFFTAIRCVCKSFYTPKRQISLPFYKLQLMKSLPFYMPGKIRKFSHLCHRHKMRLLAFLGTFTDRNFRFPRPFVYFRLLIRRVQIFAISKLKVLAKMLSNKLNQFCRFDYRQLHKMRCFAKFYFQQEQNHVNSDTSNVQNNLHQISS